MKLENINKGSDFFICPPLLDAAGRTTQIATSSYTRNFSYDYESRVTQVTGLSTTNSFTYNGFDTRTKKVDAAGTSNFQRVGARVTASLVADGSATYTPGISERRSGTTKYLHAGLKNADLQTNSSQTNTGTRRYDAFGHVVGGVGSYGGPFGYAGKFGYQSSEDAEVMLLGHRYYDPSTGRFLTRDPIKDGRNWYAYCDNNPISRTDPEGLGWHHPGQVWVSPNFDGKVFAIGEPYPNADHQVVVEIKPGMRSHPGMDIDYVSIVYPDGRIERRFLMGWGYLSPCLPCEPTFYHVYADGDIRGPGIVPFWISWLNGRVAEAKKNVAPADRLPMEQPCMLPGYGCWDLEVPI